MLADMIKEYEEGTNKLREKEVKLAELYKLLDSGEKRLNCVRLPALCAILFSFVQNVWGSVIGNPYIVLQSLLVLLAVVPLAVVIMVVDGKNSKIEHMIDLCKDAIEADTNRLILLRERIDTQKAIENSQKNVSYSDAPFYNVVDNNKQHTYSR